MERERSVSRFSRNILYSRHLDDISSHDQLIDILDQFYLE